MEASVTRRSSKVSRRRTKARILGVVAVAVANLASAPPAIAVPGTITQYRIDPDPTHITAANGPMAIAKGPDANMWFIEYSANKVGRITPSGVVTEFAIPTGTSAPRDITAGPDGNMWFTESANGADKIGRINPTTGKIREFPIPAGVGAVAITKGPGGLWFTEQNAHRIARITTAGVVTEFAVPGENWERLEDLVTGPDGNIWFTLGGSNKIGRLKPSTGAVKLFPIPGPNANPSGITKGPDGNLWFTEMQVDGAQPPLTNPGRIGRITTAGVITEFALPTFVCDNDCEPSGRWPTGIAAGPDGNLWFTEQGANMIGRITPAGAITEFAVPLLTGSYADFTALGAGPLGIAKGPDGRMWYTEFNQNQIGAITTS